MFENKIFETLCAGTGLIVIVILGFEILLWLIVEIMDWLTDKFFKCKHVWEFDDCGYTYDSSYIELKCKKCGEIKHIECDIDTTKWSIKYIQEE